MLSRGRRGGGRSRGLADRLQGGDRRLGGRHSRRSTGALFFFRFPRERKSGVEERERGDVQSLFSEGERERERGE